MALTSVRDGGLVVSSLETEYISKLWRKRTLRTSGLVGGLGSNQFGPKTGGYNVLNAPDGSYSLAKNLDWLGTATNRADRIVVTDNPMEVSNLFRSPANVDLPPGIDNYTPEQMANYLESIMDVDILNQMTVFGRETKALADNNYIYRPELREFKIN